MGWVRWSLWVWLAASVVTAVAIGAAVTASAEDGPWVALLIAMISFLVAIAFGGLWAIAQRRAPDVALVERAETASRMAHELRNPLMSVKGLASTGLRLFDQMSDDERREFFRLIDEEASRLKLVVDQSAAALAVDADRIAYDLHAEDLGALVEDVVWEAPHGQHPMSVEAEPEVRAEVDRTRMTEVITGLVDNASKYSPPDAPIDVVVRTDDRDAVLEVMDRGPGIPLDRQEDVFERFTRWRPAGYEETPGAGLGLFLSRAHVAAHGGRIEIVDREDGGSILRVRLPGGG